MLSLMNLPESYENVFPHELSAGEKKCVLFA